MGGLFSVDGPVFSFLGRMADLVILNLLTCVCLAPFFCLFFLLSDLLPVHLLTLLIAACSIFCGAPVCALHHCMIRMIQNEDGALLRSYVQSCKENFKQGNLLWCGMNLCFFVLYLDIRIAAAQGGNTLYTALQVLCGAAILALFFLMLYVFPLQARYINPVRTTLKNALILSVYALPKTILQALLFLAMPVLFYVLGIGFFPVLLLFGFSLPAYLRACLYVPLFLRLEEKEEGERTSEEDTDDP